jgi:hypothetical protein
MAKKKDTENAKRAEPQSDMETLYYEVGNRLVDEGINVNVDTLPKVEIDNFGMAMIPQTVFSPPDFPPWTFTVRMTCVVAKGYETKTRLEILKNAVRAALMKEPLAIRNFTVSAVVVNEHNTREVGVRKSELTVAIKVEHKQRK